ncbi:hypothetical protein [Thiothrix winogradskyi]|uniref:EF-hand domain-containing protein n=1 Tax=Thiothrix winogradskyi TaxID=96472 RepID=A0ABY3T143_9GAMM|nr:hypothetical protein [Thiothrix winogradskyi]UJS24680.1 hypothetical protein L2Y54_01205 [Thiothrix winogradskyi]
MNVINPNTYTNPTSYTRQNSRTDATNNRSSRDRGNQSKTSSSPFQNSDLLSALKQLVQHLVQQIQPKRDKPSGDNPNCPPQNNPQGIQLTDNQRQNIAFTLGVNADSISVADSNKDGTVSAGDQIKASFTTDTGGTETLTRTVDEGFALDINGKLGTPLDMNMVGTGGVSVSTSIKNHLGLPGGGSFHDQDGSGNLSAGDIIKSVSRDPGGQGTPSYYTLTAANMQSLKDAGIYPPASLTPPSNQPLTLSSLQRDNINAGIGFVNADNVSILDRDASGTVSEGDLFKATYIPETAQITDFERTLNANDAALINGKFGSLLPLNEDGKQPLRDALNTPAERFEAVFDRDGSGTLNTGDVALGSFNGAFGGTPPPQFPTSYVTLEVAPDGTINRKD